MYEEIGGELGGPRPRRFARVVGVGLLVGVAALMRHQSSALTRRTIAELSHKSAECATTSDCGVGFRCSNSMCIPLSTTDDEATVRHNRTDNHSQNGSSSRNDTRANSSHATMLGPPTAAPVSAPTAPPTSAPTASAPTSRPTGAMPTPRPTNSAASPPPSSSWWLWGNPDDAVNCAGDDCDDLYPNQLDDNWVAVTDDVKPKKGTAADAAKALVSARASPPGGDSGQREDTASTQTATLPTDGSTQGDDTTESDASSLPVDGSTQGDSLGDDIPQDGSTMGDDPEAAVSQIIVQGKNPRLERRFSE